MSKKTQLERYSSAEDRARREAAIKAAKEDIESRHRLNAIGVIPRKTGRRPKPQKGVLTARPGLP